MPRSSRFRGRVQTKRSVFWANGPEARDEARASTGAILWTAGVTTILGEVTLVRTRGIISLFNGVAGAIGDGMFGAVGLGIVTVKAFTAGLASVPLPLTEPEWDGWFWHNYFDLRVVSATLGDGANQAIQTLVIDSKVMRKLGEEEVIIGVVEVVESGTASVEFNADIRMLFKKG